MPNEGSRITARKTIVLPDEETISVPVITQISFIDPLERYQETEHHIDNSSDSNRIVHVDQVHSVDVDRDGVPTEATPEAGEDSLFVERIDTWNSLDPLERAQETQLTLDNRTGNDLLPPHFTNHERTHIYRYHKDPANPDDDGTWVDSELIDEFAVIDPQNRHQESHYTLTNPTNAEFRAGDISGQADATDPDIRIAGGDGEGTATNPVRLDPFQNIVNYSKGGLYVLFLYSWHDFLTPPMGERCTLTQNVFPQASTFTAGVATRTASAGAVDIVCSGDALDSLLNGATDTGGQPEVVTTALFAQSYWKFPPCFVCTTKVAPAIWYPPGDPHAGGPPPGFNYCSPEYTGPAIFADPVPYTGYERSFLFEIAATEPDEEDPTAGNTSTTKIEFDIFGLPEPRLSTWIERTLPTYPGGPGAVAFSFAEMNFNTVCQLNFTVYVFNKSAVDLYLTDKVFPLRKKGILPTAPNAVEQTKAVFKTKLFAAGTVNQGWTDESNFLHEPLSGADVNTGESGTFDGEGGTGSEAVNLNFHFEKFDVGPGHINPSIVKREIAWPVEPDGQIVTAVVSRATFDGTPVIGTLHDRQYQWNYIINGQINAVIGENEKDFGQQPMNPLTA